MSWPRPVAVARPALVLAALGAGFLGVSRTTGSGWVVVLACGVAGCLVAATLWPAASLARVRATVSAPRDGTVGRPLALEVGVARGAAGLQVRPLEPAGDWVVADPPSRGEVVARPARRGVVGAAELEVRTAAPLGLVTWRRRVRVALPVPLEVGPRPLEVSQLELPSLLARAAEAAEPGGHLGHDTVRSTREYAPGDPMRLVHWAATARWGEVMVKELEDPDHPHLVVAVDLRGPPVAAEEAASRAAGVVAAALREGAPVTLLTRERRGGVAAAVSSSLEAGRRLARAVPGPPPEAPVPPGAVLVRVAAR